MSLSKVTITSYEDADCTTEIPDGVIEAFINPDNYSKSIKVKYSPMKTINDPQPTLIFTGIQDESLTLGKIIVDGTGVVPKPKSFKDVDSYVQKFQDTVCKYIGKTHGTPYLKITWGNLSFICVCNSFDVKFTLFNPDGSPLRAEITLGLTSTADFSTKIKEAEKSSPDLTHLRIAKAGDTLPLMCYQIYGDSAYYLDVAKKNNLDSVFDIKPGTPVYFYPLKK